MEEKISLAHGSGGQKMQNLIQDLIFKYLGNDLLKRMEDAAVLAEIPQGRLVFSTDSFVVDPLIFPGGDIGKLAVCGTVNDIAAMGGRPLYLSLSLIIEEGLEIDLLKQILASLGKTAHKAGVKVVCGDTKVVNKGICDKIFINTAGIGVADIGWKVSVGSALPGDAVLISGNIGEHGIAVLAARERLNFDGQLKSDCAALNGLVAGLSGCAADIHVLRDPTRGGLATVLNEIALRSGVEIEVREQEIPVNKPTRAASELLGLDPLYMACEGRMVAVVKSTSVKKVLNVMRKNTLGRAARVIGRIVSKRPGRVFMETISGGQRIIDMQIEEQMPRIC